MAAAADTCPSLFLGLPMPSEQQLLAELAALRAEVEGLRDKVSDMEHRVGIQEDNGLTVLEHLSSLKEEIHKQPEAAKTTQKTQDHLTRIAAILGAKEKRLIEGQAARHYLARYRKEGMAFSEIAALMGLTVDRIRQLSRLAATDQRFNICWHPRKKNTKIFKLRRWDAQ